MSSKDACSEFFTVFDKGRRLDFDGYHLAHATSWAEGKPRWFIVDIYRTAGGSYIVAGTGKSLVVHRTGCSQLRGRVAALTIAKPDSVVCDLCSPKLSERVIAEDDRAWAQVSDNANAIIARLQLRNDSGTRYIPKTSLAALEDAAERDIHIQDALHAPVKVQ